MYGFNQAINRHNKIVIGRKHTQPFAINKVSTDAIIMYDESLRLDASPYNPLTKIMEISPRIRTHDYDLRNDHSDQTLLPVMSDRFKNFVTRKYY